MSPFESAAAAAHDAVNATPEQIAELRRAVDRVNQPDDHQYATGGLVTGPAGPLLDSCGYVIRISPDECFISAENVAAGRLACSRPGHPTAASDCARSGGEH